jgi:hypothetical protein
VSIGPTQTHWAKARLEDYPVEGDAACGVCGSPIRANAHGVLRHTADLDGVK